MLKRFDRAWARGEGWLTVAVLILMVFIAGFQASVRNLTRFDIGWANQMLTDLDWADSLLRKGTLWLSFLGASLATYNLKHINIDVMLRIAPPKAKYTMLALSSICAGLITFGLVKSFSDAIYLNLTERPVEYELMAENGDSMHVCDASQERIDQLEGLERPTGFCLLRGGLSIVGVPAETPGAAFQLIVPVMLFVIALRLIGHGFGAINTLRGGEPALARAEAAERARIQLQQAAVETVGTSGGTS
jgi:TRAP-type C4-dicarboxylate transport system permease small subunit